MKKVLFMHSGSKNHGCEAIVKTTSMMLNKKDLILWSFNKSEDILYGVDDFFENILESEEIKKYTYPYFKALVLRKIFKKCDSNMKIFLKNTFKNSVAISIGGDNYCYPWSAKQAIELDKEIRKHSKKSVLWGCSIDESALTKEMVDDLKDFDLITARECYTYNLLSKINSNTVKVADPAFLLPIKYKELPDYFVEGNTVGINISPLIMKYIDDDSIVLDNYCELIENILNKTEMNICLIPHVTWKDNNDFEPILYLYNKYKKSNRLSYIEDCDCNILKGYISRCRFFVGARTHATIAAYSTLVPTLVVGYSIKSKGIAADLFGDFNNYVIPVSDLKNKEDLSNCFNWIVNHEDSIKNQLEKIIPTYKDEARKGIIYFDKMINGESFNV